MKFNNKKILWLCYALLLCNAQQLWAQSSVRAYTDANKIVIGDQVRLWLEVKPANKADKISWPVVPDTFNGLELVEKGKIDTVANKDSFVLKRRYVVTGFDSGTYTIPAFSFTINGNGLNQVLSTDSLALQIVTIPVDTAKAFKPIKEIEEVPFSIWDYWPYMLGALLLLILGVLGAIYWNKRRKNKVVTAKVPPEKAHEKALRLLQELKAKGYYEQNNSKAYFSELSDIVRVYIEERFGIAAMEQTTDELLSLFKKQSDAKTELRRLRSQLKTILRTADMAKFAKANPMPQDYDTCMQAAIMVVNQTKVQEEGSVR